MREVVALERAKNRDNVVYDMTKRRHGHVTASKSIDDTQWITLEAGPMQPDIYLGLLAAKISKTSTDEYKWMNFFLIKLP